MASTATVPSKPKATRRVKTPKYQSFRLSKRLKNPRPKLPSAWSLAKASAKTLKENWKLFGGIGLIYGVLLVILAGSLASSNSTAETKQLLQEFGSTNNLENSLALFGDLVAGSGANSDTAALYQTLIVFISFLAYVWGFRQVYDGKKKTKIRVRDAFYRGMYPFIPALLVIFIIALQLLPAALASGFYSSMIASGFAVTLVESIVWWIVIGLLVLLTLYLLGSSIIALFIATLPDVGPLEALRGARKYVEHRRFEVLAKILWLLLGLMLVLALVIVPFIAFVPSTAELVFFIATIVIVPFSIGYMYNLYRALLK